MRLGILFFLVFLAIVYQYQCEETSDTAVGDTDSDDTTTVEPVTENPKAQKKTKQKKKDDDDDDDNKEGDNKDDAEEADTPKKEASKGNKRNRNRSKNGKRDKSPDSLGYIVIFLKNKTKTDRQQKPIKVRLPVARYNPKRYPRLGSLTTFLPWLPIYVEKRSKQTVIYSPTGGVYILPPVVNFYGKTYSVGQLIASGYASLVSSGAPPPPSVDVAPFIHRGTVFGSNVPTINSMNGGFTGGVTTNFPSYQANPWGAYYGYQ